MHSPASRHKPGFPSQFAGEAFPDSTPTRMRCGLAEDIPPVNSEVLRQLWQLYAEVVLPIECKAHFAHFATPPVTPEEFEAKPQVLLVGQYSTGKTSMVQWLTGVDSAHFDVKPQPSTDKFMAVVHGEEEKCIKGHAAATLPQLPYQGLCTLGHSFLQHFQTVVLPAEMLKGITLIDTPGVLAGSKQRVGRNYDYAAACAWMAERADLVLLTFDAHKLDISDEFQEVMEVFKPYADKVRCVLNKADQIDASNLVKVYGALLWNVGKVLQTPEVARVYISSFWDQAYRFQDHQQLFDEDKSAILRELAALPHTSLLRRLDSLVARVQRLRTHLYIIGTLRSHLPVLPRFLPTAAGGGDARLRTFACAHLPQIFEDVQRLHGVSCGDLPDVKEFRTRLASFEHFSSLPPWDEKDVERLRQVLEVEVPNLMCDLGGVSAVRNSLRPSHEELSQNRRSWFRCQSRKRKHPE